MKYRSLDGKTFEAESPEDLARSLWQTKFMPEPSLEEWMQGSAERARIYNGSELRMDTVEHHIQDLIAAGFLTPVPEGADDPA